MRGQMNKNITLLSFKHMIILSLVLYVSVKPISSILLPITDVKYDLFDDFEKNESTEKENNIEKTELTNYYANDIQIELNFDHTQNYYTTQSNIKNFKPEIQLPPPKL